MADKNNIVFKSGPIANINTTDIIAGQLLFAIENNTGSIYLDKDGTNRIKLNADALKLANARAINGTSFDGTSDITTTKWGTARNISIGNSDGTGAGTAVSVDGSGAITLKLPTEIKANVTSAGKLSGDSSDVGNVNTPVYFEDGIPKPITSINVKSDKAGKLDPGASINGTLFTGESNITTNTWGTARNVTIKDASETNTGEAVSVNGSGAFSLLLPATIKATLDGNAATATKATSADSATTAVSCTGNAATASKLKTGVAINGTIFDGSAAITTTSWGTARTVTISDNSGTYAQANTGINGSANFTLKLPATLAASITGNAATATKATSADSATTATTCTGNAGTATALKNARNINGTSFDGTSDITTANWGTARNIYIQDSDGSNTGVATSVNGGTNATLKLPATIKATLSGNADSAYRLKSSVNLIGNSSNQNVFWNPFTWEINTAWGGSTGIYTLSDCENNFSGIFRVKLSNREGATILSIASVTWLSASTSTPPILTITTTTNSGSITYKLYISSGIDTYRTYRISKIVEEGIAPTIATAYTTSMTGTVQSTADAVYASTATKLATARTINGTSFDGSSNITTASWGTARNVTIYSSDGTGGGTAVSVDGSGAINLKLPSTIKATLSGNASSATTAAACTGNSATATKLATARTINGTSFDGTSDITTANWGTARTIYISSTASTSGTSVNGSSNVSLIVPSTMTGFDSITSTKFVVGGKATLQYNTTNECLEFVFA